MNTEIAFTLPRGVIDEDGDLHREGIMRLATAADEIMPLRDSRVKNNPAFLVIILLSRVVTRIGAIDNITPKVIQELFAADLRYLQALYNKINSLDEEDDLITCPECEHRFTAELPALGELSATPSIN